MARAAHVAAIRLPHPDAARRTVTGRRPVAARHIPGAPGPGHPADVRKRDPHKFEGAPYGHDCAAFPA
jgi:hypothetical protein